MGPMSNTISTSMGVLIDNTTGTKTTIDFNKIPTYQDTRTYPNYIDTTTLDPNQSYTQSIDATAFNPNQLYMNDTYTKSIGSEIQEFVREVHKEIEENKVKEATGMDVVEWKKLQDDIKMCHGSLEYHVDLVYGDEVKITLPTEYLKFLKIQMPTPDFIKKKLNTDWIEGLPAIKKIDTYNDRVTKVTFADNTFAKAVCSDNDHFDLDVGITICCMKKMMGKDGNRVYNDLIRHAHKVITDNDIAREKEAKEKAEAKHKKRKAEMHRIAKKLKAKEEQIDIQKQAIIRAHQEMEGLTSEKA